MVPIGFAIDDRNNWPESLRAKYDKNISITETRIIFQKSRARLLREDTLGLSRYDLKDAGVAYHLSAKVEDEDKPYPWLDELLRFAAAIVVCQQDACSTGEPYDALDAFKRYLTEILTDSEVDVSHLRKRGRTTKIRLGATTSIQTSRSTLELFDRHLSNLKEHIASGPWWKVDRNFEENGVWQKHHQAEYITERIGAVQLKMVEERATKSARRPVHIGRLLLIPATAFVMETALKVYEDLLFACEEIEELLLVLQHIEQSDPAPFDLQRYRKALWPVLKSRACYIFLLYWTERWATYLRQGRKGDPRTETINQLIKRYQLFSIFERYPHFINYGFVEFHAGLFPVNFDRVYWHDYKIEADDTLDILVDKHYPLLATSKSDRAKAIKALRKWAGIPSKYSLTKKMTELAKSNTVVCIPAPGHDDYRRRVRRHYPDIVLPVNWVGRWGDPTRRIATK